MLTLLCAFQLRKHRIRITVVLAKRTASLVSGNSIPLSANVGCITVFMLPAAQFFSLAFIFEKQSVIPSLETPLIPLKT